MQPSQAPGSTGLGSSATKIYRIPVVVHVIHLGEPLGQGSNIADEQIFEQMQTLNDDFRRRNADTVHTPSFFKNVAVDARIEFVLAKEDPEGLPTNGIVRVDASNAREEHTRLSYWPAEDYMNVWVMDMGRAAPYYAGSAQFPVSSLPGLENIIDERLTDGVLVNHKFFGRGYDTWPTSQGRTLTHEVGHFLGLLHTWGHGGCAHTDYCDDTPGSGAASYNCNEMPACEGPLRVMYENFMDYSSDACMNMFTRNQMARMHTVLENSPRRLSLLTSHGFGPEPMAGGVLSCYPNPARATATIQFDVVTYPDAAVEVANAMGQVLLKDNIKDRETMLDVSGWEGGIYLVKVRHQGFTGAARLLKVDN